MTWIKICGITNLDDALTAADAGADALGFVFYEKSPRNIAPEEVERITGKLPDRVDKVGVFVDADPEHIRAVVARAGLTIVQLHGEESIRRMWADPRPTIECLGVSKVIPVIPGDSLKDDVLISPRRPGGTFALLLDSRSNSGSSGTGTTFDWEGTQGMVQSLGLLVPVIVAGGLTPSNVARALRLLQPFGVDVASGVEACPGKKDPGKVREFINAVRNTDRKNQ